jgi:hypothetical protein
MKYILSFLILSFTISCESQTLKEQFLNALTTSTYSNVNYKNDITGKIRVISPNGFNQKKITVINTLINYDLSTYSSSADCEKYLSNYEVKTLSYNFISLKKSLSSMFCDAQDDIDYEVYNFFLANDGVVYNINLKKSNYIMDEVNKFIVGADIDCNYSIENINLYLLFKNNKPKLFIVKDKVCNGMIDLDINKLEFIFNNTNVAIPKSETYIVN